MELPWGGQYNAAAQGMLCAAVFWMLHLHLTRRDARCLAAWLSGRCFRKLPPDPWAARLETALMEARKANWLMLSSCASFFTAGAISYWMYSFHISPSLKEGIFFGATSATHIMFMATATRAVTLTASQIWWFVSIFYLAMMVCTLALPFTAELNLDAKVMMVQVISCRFINTAVAIDTKLSAPWQVLLSACQLWADLQGPGLRHPGFGAFLQGVVCGLTIVLSFMLESGVRANLRAQFHCSDAESLMFSFRRMLRGICDGELLLDSNLQIHSVSDCLKHLLMTSTNLHGKPFTQVLASSDVKRFQDFIQESCQEVPQAPTSAPPCLHVSLVGAAGTRVSVELFHVPISKLYGSHDPYHLIALKEEDADSCQQTESTLQESEQSSRQLARPEGAQEALARPCAILVELLCQLPDVSLLVDTSTAHYVTRQASLRFPSQWCSSNEPPNLRSVVLPTAWPSIQHELERYTEEQEASLFAISPRLLPALGCRMIGHASGTYRVAQKVEVSPHRGTKVWLRLSNFAERSSSREHLPQQSRRKDASRSRPAEPAF